MENRAKYPGDAFMCIMYWAQYRSRIVSENASFKWEIAIDRSGIDVICKGITSNVFMNLHEKPNGI